MTARAEELDLLFSDARTHNAWLDRPVSDELLRKIVDLTKLAPTGGNGTPLRVVFVRSGEAKEKLRPALNPGNVDKTMSAPVTAILAYDVAWWTHLDTLFPARAEMKAVVAGLPEAVRDAMGTQNADIQSGYFILAARALGLDCGPMGGFDRAKVDEAFLVDKGWKSRVLVNLGHGDREKLFPRNPRLGFEETAIFA